MYITYRISHWNRLVDITSDLRGSLFFVLKSLVVRNIMIRFEETKIKEDMNTKTYMNGGEHLPDFMKDFHDQKDLFKAIYGQWKDGETKVLEDVNWVDAHVFTIDYFLWWMGHNGYKLQKIRKKGVEFYDPVETIEKCNNIRRGVSSELLKNAMP